jgi:hypothetical protein
MPGLLLDPTTLLTKLPKLNYSDYLPSANPLVDAARQRLQGSQQDLIGQNAAMQQQMLQQQMMRQQQRQMRQQFAAAMANAHGLSGAGTPGNYSGTAGPAPRGQITNWINQALQLTGHTGGRHDALVNGLYQMIMHESGGNPNIQNNWDSNAKAGTPSIGLMQTILPTFNQYAIRGHRNVRNPVDNIIAGLRYALANYGYGMVMGGGRHDSRGNYLGY